MFILGIGKDVDPSELDKIASGPDNVFKVDSFEDLDDKADELKRGICILGIYFDVVSCIENYAVYCNCTSFDYNCKCNINTAFVNKKNFIEVQGFLLL